MDSELASFRQRSRDHRNNRGLELDVVLDRVNAMSGQSSMARSSYGEPTGGGAGRGERSLGIAVTGTVKLQRGWAGDSWDRSLAHLRSI